MASHPPLGRVLETSLYVRDPATVCRFYEDVLGLEPMMHDERLTAYAVGPGSVLLLFRQGTTDEPAATPGGIIPSHDGSGRLHFAFATRRARTMLRVFCSPAVGGSRRFPRALVRCPRPVVEFFACVGARAGH